MTRIRRDPAAGRTLAELIFGIALISGVIALIGTLFLPGRWYFLGGVIAGAVAAILLVINMYDSIDAALSMNEKRAKNYASLHAVLRIAITGVLLVIAYWIDLYCFRDFFIFPSRHCSAGYWASRRNHLSPNKR